MISELSEELERGAGLDENVLPMRRIKERSQELSEGSGSV